MTLPGLEESVKEFELIGGKKMEKPKFVRVDSMEGSAGPAQVLPDPIPPSSEPGIRRLLSEMLDEMERNITVLIDRNAQLEKENQKLRFDNQRIREILGG